ncbi:MAG TPA: hypothetical protein VFZ70_02435 [Euzebyales bacterium]
MKSKQMRRGVVTGLASLILAGGALPAAAGERDPLVEIGSPARLAPDSGSISVELTARCPARRTLLDARVRVAQPQASGETSFTLVCDGVARDVTVDVPSAGGSFETGQARVDAVVSVQQGKVTEARDSAVVAVHPIAAVHLAGVARLEGGGEAVVVDVTVACPASSTGRVSEVSVFKYPADGTGSFVPACDGGPHTVTVTVPASGEPFRAGAGFAAANVVIEDGGAVFDGLDYGDIEIVDG